MCTHNMFSWRKERETERENEREGGIERERVTMYTVYKGPVVQSIVSLTSLLVVKMLTVLVNI